MEEQIVVKRCKTKRILADGTIKEYIVNKKVPARKKDFQTSKMITDEVKQKIRDEVVAGMKKKAICEKYNISYFVLRELLK